MKRLFFLFPLFLVLATDVFAAEKLQLSNSQVETLPLSESQIEKLRAYLPADDESAPLIWKGDPLSIVLPVHAEKRVVFPEPIEAHLNGALNSDQLRIINNDQSLYLTALKAFDTTRMYVSLKNSKKIILLDVSTDDKASHVTRTVKLESASKNSDLLATKKLAASFTHSISSMDSVDTNAPDTFSGSANHYVDAIRFAWQQLYAPKRLLNHNTDFARTPMHTQQWVSDLIYGDKVLAHPQISWLAGDLYVTAIELRNKYTHTTMLNLSHDLCGQWQAATLYPHVQLKPAGNKAGDSTTLFLLSDKPFGDILEDCHGSA